MEKAAFIWDLDGTLLDSYGIIVSSLHTVCHEFNIERDEKDILKEVITHTIGDFIAKMEQEEGIDSDSFKHRFSQINDGRKLDIRPVKNAAEILSFLKSCGIPNFVFTHKGASAVTVLKNTDLYDYFEEVITGKDGFARKPDPAAVNYLIRKYQLDKSTAFYVGDRTLDVECACNAGIKSILYLPENSVSGTTGKETFVVKDLLEIKEIIR